MKEIKSRMATIEEIRASNPRLCLSPLRYLGKCHKCPVYISTTGKPCNSRIVTTEGETELQAIKEKKEHIKNLKKELKDLEAKT